MKKIRPSTPLKILKKDTLIDLLILLRTIEDISKNSFENMKQLKIINTRMLEGLEIHSKLKTDCENSAVLLSECFYSNLEICSNIESLVKDVRKFISIEKEVEIADPV